MFFETPLFNCGRFSTKRWAAIAAKQAYSNDKKGEVVESSYLAYLNDTIQIVPLTLVSTEPTANTTNASYPYDELSEMPAEELLALFIQNGLVINDDLKAAF